MFDEPKVMFWPVGTGDSTTVVVQNGIVLQVDLRDLHSAGDADDDHAALVDKLVENLPTVNGKPYLSTFALTHPDKDHIQGFHDLLDRVTIGEIWFTPRVFIENDQDLCDDAVAFKEEAERRVQETINSGGDVGAGDRVRLIGYDALLKEDHFVGFPEDRLTVPGNSITEIDGVDYEGDFNAFIHAPFAEETDGDRNNTSLCMQVVLGDNPSKGGVLLFGDIAYPRLRKIIDKTKEAGNEEYLAWKVFLAPHHCSKSAMYQKEGDKEVLKQDILDDLAEYQVDGGVIVASSEKIPLQNASGENPPHAKAKKRYEEIADGGFLCTHEDGEDGEPLVFDVSDGALDAPEVAQAAAARKLADAVDDARGSDSPPRNRSGMADFTTRGQQLALDQLQDIAAASDDTIDIVDVKPPAGQGLSLVIRVSIDTSGYAYEDGGFDYRRREPLNIFVSPHFPVEPPRVYFAHKRFLGRAHVQWGDYLCLYQATDVEWASQDGMFGLIKRLDDWLRDAARNQLDPEDAPLHPPVEYTSSDIKLAVEIDAPEIEDGKSFWLGTGKLTRRNDHCFDISEWSETPSSLPKDEKFAAVVLLNQAMPMEYPDTISKLITTLEARGVPFDLLFSILKIFALCQPDNEPLYFILGAPMRRRAADEPLRQHLSAWKMDAEYVKALQGIILEENTEATLEAWKVVLEWATEAKTEWCRVYDNRPEVTFRRDQGTKASWFLGKKIALLGCGALGSHIGEYLARAGAEKIRLVDYSAVNAGILVRQQFRNYQVGYSKQSALSVQLRAINPKADIDHEFANLTKGWPEALNISDFDLVIDATASRRVATALQLDLTKHNDVPPMLRCAISANASKGIATLNMPGSAFGPADLLRRTKVAAMSDSGLTDFAEAFWPFDQHERGFQPEPGCSEPTFVGSAADIAFFASSFFNFAASALREGGDSKATACFVRVSHDDGSMSSHLVPLCQPSIHVEAHHGYRVHLSHRAQSAIDSEIKSNARTGSAKDETGGILLGEIDDALGIISIDVATGPPPDSKKSPELFECGIEGTHALCEFHAKESGNSTKFVGVWHTHPVSIPKPSMVDLGAMAQILHLQEKTPRHVVMLIVGHAATRPTWRFHLFRRNEFQVVTLAAGESVDE